MKKCGFQPPCWFLLILAQFSLSENFELSSSPSVIGNVGEDAILPCQMSLGTQPQYMEVQWKKHHDNHYDDIYQFTDNMYLSTRRETFGPGYQARAMLATKEGIATGNVSLRLKKIQVHDGGIYKCVVQTRDLFAETQTVLHIAALGNVSIEVLGPEGDGIKLACKSAGWYPKPELQWLTKNSQHPQTEYSQDHEQLFSVWSNITALRDMGEITCLVYESNHLQMKRESTILLSRNIFPHFPAWLLAFWILFNLTLLAVGAAVYFRHQGKQKRKHNEEEQIILLGDQKELLQKCNAEMTRMHQENHDLKKTVEALDDSLRKCKEEKERQHQENQELNKKLESMNTELGE